MRQSHGPCSLGLRSIPVGWCSWYHFYDKISETNLQANLTMMASLKGTPIHPLTFFPIHSRSNRRIKLQALHDFKSPACVCVWARGIAEELPLQLFQIDDGYQAAWGDWTSLDKAKYVLHTHMYIYIYVYMSDLLLLILLIHLEARHEFS